MQQINDEMFVDKWWSSLSSPLSLDLEEWIRISYQGNENFWKEVVFTRQEQILPPSQSVYEKSYNFYHDCILRHIKSNNTAFSVIKENQYTDNWTYQKLHQCVNYHVDKWTSYLPQPGQLIAIVSPPNIHFLICLLTALRFGLQICYLPTNSSFLGKGQIQAFLSEIKPQLIAAEDPSFSIGGIPLLVVNEKGFDEENHEPHAFDYPAAQDVQLTLSLQDQIPLTFEHLDAQSTYMYALRDALFTLNLPQHSHWASPLACPIRTEPCSTLMTLLCGSARLYVPEEAIKKNPRILEDERIHLLGISSALRQLWNQTSGLPTRNLKCCYKNPLDSNFQSWKTFAQLNKAEKIPVFDLLMDSSKGGSCLFSRPTLDPNNVYLKATLGTSWSLTHLNGSGEEATSGYGIFNTDFGESNFTAAQMEKNLMLTGSVEPCREGVTFPIIEVEKLVNTLPFVEICMVHHLQKMGTSFDRCFVLLVFIDPMKGSFSVTDQAHWTKEIEKIIEADLGNGYAPDKVEYFSLMPKTNIFGIDRSWCAQQYNSGLLLQKKDISHFQTLGALKKLTLELAKEKR